MIKNILDSIKSTLFGGFNKDKNSKADFDWQPDEKVFDQESVDIFSSSSKIRPKAKIAFYLVIAVVFGLVWFKLWDLQIVQGEYNSQLAADNRIRNKMELAPRGMIYDREGVILASNQPGYALIIYPADLPRDDKEKQQIFKDLTKHVEIDKDYWQKIISQELYKLDPMVLKENLNESESLILREVTSSIKAVDVEDQIRRKYDGAKSLSHILGYIGKISEEEFNSLNYDDISLADYTGKSGLERSYDEYLRGQKGVKQVEVDSLGRVERILAEREPEVGNSLYLTLDYDLQKKSQAILTRALADKDYNKGSVVVSNPQTGEILAMVSLPGYDNNIFNSRDVNKEYSKLLNDQDNPLFNRTISGLYPSGSVIKPIVAVAALEEEVINENTTVFDTGDIVVENIYNPDITYRFKSWKAGGHGLTNVTKAIAESVNVFFYHIGGGFDHIKGLGYQRISEYFKKFGLGQPTGIDLPLEEKGLIPSPEWKERVKNEVWYQGDTYHLSIGQGDLLVTPLQVNNYISAIANNGIFVQPHLTKKIIDANGEIVLDIEPAKSKRVASNKNIDIVRKGMRMTVTQGTAPLLQNLPVNSAGKTGTAQNPQGDGKEHAWFTAFAPYNNPEIAITVLVENAGEGSRVALPIANDILSYYFSK